VLDFKHEVSSLALVNAFPHRLCIRTWQRHLSFLPVRLLALCCALALALVAGADAALLVGPNVNVTKSAEGNSETFGL